MKSENTKERVADLLNQYLSEFSLQNRTVDGGQTIMSTNPTTQMSTKIPVQPYSQTTKRRSIR
ncbi:MAG TPA: hypothetical protein V6C65_04465 [Allocoleopsis sp.]